jgi:hypothetical protein
MRLATTVERTMNFTAYSTSIEMCRIVPKASVGRVTCPGEAPHALMKQFTEPE